MYCTYIHIYIAKVQFTMLCKKGNEVGITEIQQLEKKKIPPQAFCISSCDKFIRFRKKIWGRWGGGGERRRKGRTLFL